MMMTQLVDIGHTAVMLPAAAAITAWFVVGRSWRLALLWCLIFCAGLGIVALSKVAFLGWKTGIPSVDFQALSGHAFRSAAVIPVLAFIVLRSAPVVWRALGVGVGLAVSVGVGVLLVRFQFHTASEVIPSLVLGSAVSLSFMRVAHSAPAPRLGPWSAPISLVIFLLMCGLKPSRISPHLVDVALYLSGRDHPYSWSGQRDTPSSPLICRPANSRF